MVRQLANGKFYLLAVLAIAGNKTGVRSPSVNSGQASHFTLEQNPGSGLTNGTLSGLYESGL